MKNFYSVSDSWILQNKENLAASLFIPKNTKIVVTEIDKKGSVKFYHQGHSSIKLDISVFDTIPKEEIVLDDEFIFKYVIPNDNIKKIDKVFKELTSFYSENPKMKKIIRSLKTWIFSTKGSSCIKGFEYFKLDFNNLPWVNKSGFKSKPYDWYENRSGRTTVYPDNTEIEVWVNDPFAVLPIGIKKNEHCSYYEMYKIGRKILQEVCGLEGIDKNFARIVKGVFEDINEDYKHFDFLTGDRIHINIFDENTHHGKKKGLELCHLDPNLEFATTCENITLGLSESNRKQSGNSIIDMGYHGTNGFLISIGKSPLTKEEYIYFLKKI